MPRFLTVACLAVLLATGLTGCAAPAAPQWGGPGYYGGPHGYAGPGYYTSPSYTKSLRG
jgi:hypothetical protein